MAASEDLINFDVIESHKENIQALPGGRSAKKLAELYSPSPLHKLSTPAPSDSKNVNDCIRAEYEAEIESISESDDPLDIFDRYVRWTLDAYPSAQATPQSQLHTLLERATKAFIPSAQYKNDPRYLRLWMQYIHLFSDSPRETYLYLSRHAIGEGLALFYEEYAAWLEGAGRWAQADEVYKLGIEREARPVQRLLRKFKEFEERLAQQPEAAAAPSSPALPTVRPALASKADPFGSSWRPGDPQAPREGGGVGGATSKSAKSKLAIFSDAEAKPSPLSSMGEGSRGWDTIGSMSDRKKENTVEAKPWVGETLKAGVKKGVAPKMAVFRDPSLSHINNIVVVPSKNQVTIHPQTGKKECIFVELAAIYPAPEQAGMELSFEEIVAANRGWLDHVWGDEVVDESRVSEPDSQLHEVEGISRGVVNKLVVHQDGVMYDENGAFMEPPRDPRLGKKKKKMVMNETQIIKAKLDSPSGPKLRKKNTSEPTMTLHTKAATDDIYEIFNAPLQESGAHEEAESADEDDYETDGDYTTDAESAGTTRVVDAGQHEEDEASDARSASEWSDFATHKHVPSIEGGDEVEADERHTCRLDRAERYSSEQSGQLAKDTPPPEDDQGNESAVEGESSPRTRTIYVPPPPDYDPPTRPFRDPVEVANSRLPFMTPITERTECSLDVDAERRGQHKTPCKGELSSATVGKPMTLEPPSSPLREIDYNVDDDGDDGGSTVSRVPEPPAPKAATPARPAAVAVKGPMVHDKQCNPVDRAIRRDILDRVSPPLASYTGFHDHRGERYGRGAEIRRFAKALSKANRSGADKAAAPPEAVVLRFPHMEAGYTLKRELGAGAFAPVYLVENSAADKETHEGAVAVMGQGAFAVSRRSKLEALKMESPPTPWEFYMMRVAHTRLGPQHRAAASLSYAHEMHIYQDEAFLFLPYHAHGTLLDLVNLFRTEPSGVMDELLAMFFTVELLRTVEALHSKGVMHGDIKPDNCLLRLDPAASEQQPLAAQWRADGGGGWSSRGLVLIDFGRAIDFKAFEPDVEFIADWKTNAQDCAEMREGRPWTWQIDYHGLAGTVHCLLFGKYMETARCDEGGLGRTGRRYRIRESLKRYWQTGLWADMLELLLNPGSCLAADGAARMPVVGPLRAVRERMEDWLEANCERGVGLRSLVGKLEAHAKNRR